MLNDEEAYLTDLETALSADCPVLTCTGKRETRHKTETAEHASMSESAHSLPSTSYAHRFSRVQFLYHMSLRVLALVGCLALLMMIGGTRPWGRQRLFGDCDCGSSIAEAKSRGCVWDALAGAWLPARCRDEELTSQFEMRGANGGGWTYYADESRTTQLSPTEVSLLVDGPNTTYWVTADWHVEHCLFYWKKKYRRGRTKKLLEARFDNLNHVEHCEELILRWGDSSNRAVMKLRAELNSEWVPD